MRRSVLLFCVFIAFLSSGTHASHSPVLYDNGVSVPANFPLSGPSIQFVGSQLFADDFTVAQRSRITDVHWTGRYLFDPNSKLDRDVFNIAICNDFSQPLTCNSLGLNLSTLTRAPVGDYFSYSVDIKDYLLDVGVYWIEVANSPIASSGFVEWGWGSNIPGGNAHHLLLQPPSQGSWKSTAFNMDFRLTGYSISEPGSIALVAFAFVGLGLGCRTHSSRVARRPH